MPPTSETKSSGNPSGLPYSVTIEVERTGLIVGADQEFRFTITAQHIDNPEILPNGGTFTVFRKTKGQKRLVLFSVGVPSPKNLQPAQWEAMTFVGVVVVHGIMPVEHNADDCFMVGWNATRGGKAINPLPYGYPIAAFR